MNGFGDRFSDGADDVKVYMDESKDAYVYRLDVPNLRHNQFNINFDGNGINVKEDFSQRVEENSNRLSVRQDRLSID